MIFPTMMKGIIQLVAGVKIQAAINGNLYFLGMINLKQLP